MGLVLAQSGQTLKAVTLLREAVSTQEKLANSYPDWTDFQRDLG